MRHFQVAISQLKYPYIFSRSLVYEANITGCATHMLKLSTWTKKYLIFASKLRNNRLGGKVEKRLITQGNALKESVYYQNNAEIHTLWLFVG